MGKPETETDLKALLTARRVERANQYNQLKLLPKTPDNIKLLDDTIVRGKRIRAAIDFLDGK